MQHNTNTHLLFTLIVCVSSVRSALGNGVGDPHNIAVNEEPSGHIKKVSISPDTHGSPCSNTQRKNSPHSIIYSCCKPYCKQHLSVVEEDEENDDVDHRNVF